jgi:hypothetical protein
MLLRGNGVKVPRDHYFATRFKDGAWDCPHCSLHKRTRWLEHLGEMFHEWGKALCVATMSRDDWKWVSARIRRKAKKEDTRFSYATVLVGPDTVRVYSTMLIPWSGDFSFDLPVEMTPEQAVNDLDHTITAMPLVWPSGEDLYRPIHTSTDWNLPIDKKKPRYKRVGWLPADAPERADCAANRMGLPCWKGGPWGINVAMSRGMEFPGWSEKRIKDFWDWLAWGDPEGISFEQWCAIDTC